MPRTEANDTPQSNAAQSDTKASLESPKLNQKQDDKVENRNEHR